jgi:transketolase
MAATQTASIEELQAIARQVRRNIIRMVVAAKSGHPGGSLSAVEIMVALYFRVMRHDPKDPAWPDRDRVIVSKGHATPLVYGTMGEAGYFDTSEFDNFRTPEALLQGHVVMGKPAGVEMSAGALGMGLSFSIGQALAGRLDGKDYHVFCLMSDGDCEEGQTWEAIMSAGHYKLENLIAIVDRNHIQNDGFSDYMRFPNGDRPDKAGGWVMEDSHTANIMDMEPFADKWRAFRWNVVHLPDGHDLEAVIGALEGARAHEGSPTVLICETTKGKGVSFMENNPDFHGKAPDRDQTEQAYRELAD